MKIITRYVNNAGKTIIIKNMPGPYLLNSYGYYKKRLDLMDEQFGNNKNIAKYRDKVKIQVDSLWAEIQERNLLPTPN